jgi:hypothetical protein
VLAGSVAHAVCEAMDWKWGIERGAADARFLWYHSRQRARRARPPGFAHQPDEGPVLERSHQRHRGRSPDGRDHYSGLQKIRDGAFTVSWPILILDWIATAIMGAAAILMFIPG